MTVKVFWETSLEIMKRVLRIGEFKFGKESDQYRFFKEEVMNAFYLTIKRVLQTLVMQGILEECECKANLRHGWSNCKFCSGSGYREKVKKE